MADPHCPHVNNAFLVVLEISCETYVHSDGTHSLATQEESKCDLILLLVAFQITENRLRSDGSIFFYERYIRGIVYK